MPSFYDDEHDHPSRPRWGREGSNENQDYYEKPPRAYDQHPEHDVRHQYPQTVPRPHAPQSYHSYQSYHRPRRRWPPLPKAEDEGLALSHEYRPVRSDTSLEDAQSRGTVDQQPIILDVKLPPDRHQTESPDDFSDSDSDSSSASSEPETPTDSVIRSKDQRYVYIPKEGIEIPLTYDEAMDPKSVIRPSAPQGSERPRGRTEKPRLKTELESHDSLKAELPPRERAPSPYSYVPQSKAQEAFTTSEKLLSPEAISPEVGFSRNSQEEPPRGTQSVRERSRRPPPLNTTRDMGHDSMQAAPRSPRPSRPPMARHASAATYSGEPTTPASAASRSRSYYLSSDESDGSRQKVPEPRTWQASGQESVDSPRKYSMPMDRDRTPIPGKKPNPGLGPASPPPRARSSVGERALPSLPVHPVAGLQAANVLLQNVQQQTERTSPRASPTGSPLTSPTRSPFASPPGTPPSERNRRGDLVGRTRHTVTSQTPPSPGAPRQSPQTPRTPNFVFSDGEPPRRYAPRSRKTSPLPAPVPASSFGPQIDIRAPSPANHRKSFSNGTQETKQAVYNGSRHLSLARFDTEPSALKPPTVGQRRRASSSADTRPRLDNLATESLDKVHRSSSSSRRPSMCGRAVSVGALPMTLPPCPRSTAVAGFDDWYRLAGGPDDFSICPTCREAIFNAGFERHLKPKSKQPSEYSLIRCDFSVSWVRMAWTSTLKKRHGDMDLLYDIADILAREPPCTGKVEEVRDWYRLTDPETGRSIYDFQVCSQCVRSLETMQPTLRAVFHKSHGHRQRRTCSLRADSKRFTSYLDVLVDTAKQAEEYRRPPNMFRFTGLAQRIAGIPECSRDDMLQGQEWYIIPQLPELTVCEDCYDEAIWPAIKRDLPVATDFKRHPKEVAPSHVRISCQLYSPRMRKLFQEACHRDDPQLLRNAALQRYKVEKDLQARNLEVQKWPREERAREVARLVEEWKRWE